MALKILAGRQVQLAYRLTDLEGHVLEERTPDHVYEYIQGQGQILPALENVLNGKTAGYTAEMQLTAREAEVLERIAQGLDNAQIAAHLGISEKTVRNNITHIFDKLAVENRSQAIVLARNSGLGKT